MGIQRLEIDGFRSFRQVVWQPGKLNLLVGPNASGKSNLLRLFELIRAAATASLTSSIRSEGGIVPLLWNDSVDSFRWAIKLDPVDPGRDRQADAIAYEVRLGRVGASSSYEIIEESLSNRQQFEQGKQPSPWWIYLRNPRSAKIYDQRTHGLVDSTPFLHDPNESLLGQILDPLTNPIPTLARNTIATWRVYSSVRFDRGAPIRLPATTQVAQSVDQDGGNLTNVLHSLYTDDREFRRSIDEGMAAAFGADYESIAFPPAASEQVQLAVRWRSARKPHVASKLSDGTLRFLLLLTVFNTNSPPSVIAIDEPEVGLHPSMLPIVADAAAAAAERTQVVIVTHSPEMLNAFSGLSPSVTLFEWEGGETLLHELSGPDFSKWLARYCLGELFKSGELDLLAQPPVETNEVVEGNLRRLSMGAE